MEILTEGASLGKGVKKVLFNRIQNNKDPAIYMHQEKIFRQHESLIQKSLE